MPEGSKVGWVGIGDWDTSGIGKTESNGAGFGSRMDLVYVLLSHLVVRQYTPSLLRTAATWTSGAMLERN